MSAGVVADTRRPRLPHARIDVRAPTRTTAAVVALTVVAAVLRFVGIGHQSFWYDESFTQVLMHHSPGQMLSLLPQTELTPPLYYCVAWLWTRVFGYGEAGLRSLSALAGIATVPVIYAAGARLISPRTGLIAAALACCNPLLIWYSQEARSYSLLVLLGSLSLLMFASARLPDVSTGALWLWALFAGLTLATHYYSVVLVVPEALWLLWVHRRERRVLLAIGAVGAVGLALLPLALSQRPNASWIATWPLDQRLSQVAPQYLLGTGAPARTWLKLAGAVAVVLAAVLLARRADPAERRTALLVGGLGLAGFLLSLLLVATGVDELITRNVILVLIPLIVLLAAGLGARRAGLLGVAGAATLCIVGLVATIGVAAEWQLQRPAWRALVRVIGSTPPSGAGRAVLLQNAQKLLPLPVYMPRLRFMNANGARVDEVDVITVTHPRHSGWFCWWGSTCNLPGSKLDRSIRLPGFHRDGPLLHVEEFTVLRLRSELPVRLTPTSVRRAVARSRGPVVYSLMVQPGALARAAR